MMNTTPEGASQRKKAKAERLAYSLAAVVLVGTGSTLMVKGWNAPPEHTPDIATTIVAPKDQKPVGPTKAANGIDPTTMKPNKLLIPAINVYADIDESGANGTIKNGEFVLPEPSKLARNKTGATVQSTTGALMLSGHVKWNQEKGSLYDLAKVPVGSQAFVTDAKGNRQGFYLKSLEPIKKKKLPESVWQTTGPERLVTITCGGKLVQHGAYWGFESNIVGTWLPLGKA